MKAMLRLTKAKLYYYVGSQRIGGAHPTLHGDVSGLLLGELLSVE
jgi:hypothetical protein